MTYATEIQEQQVAFFTYATIGGEKTVFASALQPSAWTLPSDWSWERSLVMLTDPDAPVPTSFSSVVGQEMDLWRGVSDPGEVQILFRFDPDDPDDPWLDRYCPVQQDVVGSDVQKWWLDPAETIKPSDTTLPLVHANGLSSSEALFINGRERVNISSVAAPNIVVDRAQALTEPHWYGPRGGQAQVQGSTTLERFALDWAGRTFSLWQALQVPDGRGNLVALSADVQGDHDREILRGTIVDARMLDGFPGFVLTVQSLDARLDTPVISRPRIYRPGPATPAAGWVYVEAGGPSLVQWEADWSNYTPLEPEIGGAVPLTSGVVDINGVSGGAFENDRLGVASEIMDAVVDELNQIWPELGLTSWVNPEFRWWLESQDDSFEDGTLKRKIKMAVRFRIEFLSGANSILIPDGSFVLRTVGARQASRSVLRFLGASEDIVFDGSDATDEGWIEAEFKDEVPFYGLSALNTRVYWWADPLGLSIETGDPPQRQGSWRRDGRMDDVYVRFGKQELMELRMRQPATTTSQGALFTDPNTNASDVYYAEVVRRGLGPAGEAKDIVVKYEDREKDESQLEVVLYFDDHDLMHVVLWLLNSNGDPATGYPWSTTPFDEVDDFEVDLGNWSQDATDDFDWTRDSGGTPSSGVGPEEAASGSFYMYTEASGASREGEVARLECDTDFNVDVPEARIGFWYNRRGDNMGPLTLQWTDDDGSTWQTMWSVRGVDIPQNGTSTWRYVDLSLAVHAGITLGDSDIRFRFVATLPSSNTSTTFHSDMAIDAIRRYSVHWNVLPEGMGAALPEDFIDVGAFLALQRRRPGLVARNLVLDGGVNLREFLGNLGVALGVAIVPSYGAASSDTGSDLSGALRMAPTALVPLTPDEDSAASIDLSWYHPTEEPLGFDPREREIVNVIRFAFDLDPVSGDYLSHSNDYAQGDSVGRHGLQGPIEIPLPWVLGSTDARATLEALANWYLRLYAWPHYRIRVPFRKAAGWLLQIGDVVDLTASEIPNVKRKSGESPIGITAENMQVIGVMRDLVPITRAGELILLWRPRVEARRLGLGLELLSQHSGATYNVSQHRFTPEDGDEEDLDAWMNLTDPVVRVFDSEDDAVEADKTVSSIDQANSRVTLSSTTAITLPALLEFSTYTNETDEQKEGYVFIGDDDDLQVNDERSADRWT